MNEQMVACFKDYFGADPEMLPSFWMAWSRAWNFGRGEMAWQVTKAIDDETAEGIGAIGINVAIQELCKKELNGE
jgi:hypothetical protein